MEFGLEGLDGNGNGSGLVKQERSDPFDNGDSKMGKQSDAFGLRSDINSKQQMLSFSTNSRTSMGFGSGNTNGSMHGSFTGIRGPFTPAQWIELEHQAMIYKYFTANVPVPSNLLLPIRKAIQSAGFPGFSIGSYSSHSYGWGAFHLGFSNNTDPEPGRCRRTDGKKWRCSRDAVPDQKYCERHINRGRHRSRKPVEGQTGQAASGTATTKVVPAMSASMSPLVQTCGGVPSGAAIAQHHIKGLQPAGAINASTDPITKRLVDQQGLSMMPPTINLESKGSQYSIPKQHISFDESSASDFGVVSNDSFLNPTQKRSYLDSKCYNSLMDFDNQQTGDQSTLRHFVDNWPKDQSDRSTTPWPKDQSDRSTATWPKDLKPDWTQLSMSIPMSADFSSSSSSPNRELDPSRLGPGVGTIVAEEGTRQNAWTPVTWGNSNSMGGPLGEVLLNNASNTLDKAGNSQLGFSPTGVLQKSTFVSLSNSSSGGSPRGDLLGSAARANTASIPSL